MGNGTGIVVAGVEPSSASPIVSANFFCSNIGDCLERRNPYPTSSIFARLADRLLSLCDLFELFGNAFTGAITDDVPLNASNVTVDDLVAEDGFEDI